MDEMAIPNRSEYVTLTRRAGELVAHFGGIRVAARVLDINHAYFFRILSGEKKNPSQKILRRMGLKDEVQYKRIHTEE